MSLLCFLMLESNKLTCRIETKASIPSLAERERKGLQTGIEKLDLELTINDWGWLPDQLIHSLLGSCATALLVHIYAVGVAWRLSIYEHTEAYGSSSGRG